MNTFEQWLCVLALSVLIFIGVYLYVMRSNMDVPPSAERAVPPGKDWHGREMHETP